MTTALILDNELRKADVAWHETHGRVKISTLVRTSSEPGSCHVDYTCVTSRGSYVDTPRSKLTLLPIRSHLIQAIKVPDIIHSSLHTLTCTAPDGLCSDHSLLGALGLLEHGIAGHSVDCKNGLFDTGNFCATLKDKERVYRLRNCLAVLAHNGWNPQPATVLLPQRSYYL